MPGVDIAIPCYQYGRFLRDCVTSVLTQGLDEVRVLIIDNASTDDSLEVARQLAAEDDRVEVVAHRTNLGAHASFNEGVDWASSDYFMVLCADDFLAPGCLARAVSVLERHPDVCLAYGRAASIRPGDRLPALDSGAREPRWRIYDGQVLLERFCRTGVCHIAGPTVVVRTSAQKEAGHYRPELPHTDDFELWMRFARLGRIAETEAVQGISRVHGSNRSALMREAHTWDLVHCAAAFESFFVHEGASLPNAGPLRRSARRSLEERAYWSAVSHLCRGQAGTGLELFKFAFRYRPLVALLPPVGYLFRREDAVSRLAWLLSQMLEVWCTRFGAPVRIDR